MFTKILFSEIQTHCSKELETSVKGVEKWVFEGKQSQGAVARAAEKMVEDI